MTLVGSTGFRLDRYRGADLLPAGELGQITPRLADVWDEAYRGTPKAADPWFSRESFLERLTGGAGGATGTATGRGYAHQQGFELLTTSVGPQLVGFGYGFDLTPQRPWLSQVTPPLPSSETGEDGRRSWAVAEIVVAQDWRRAGIATAMHEAFDRALPHSRFVLLVEPANTAAVLGYLSWGYRAVGSWTAPGFPAYTAMVLDRDPAREGGSQPAAAVRAMSVR